MADITQLRARRETLTAQRSSGVARVSYDGKTVDYRSLAEIDRAIEMLDRDIATAEGRRIIRQVRVITTKGL
jgi:hypothetical protein